VPTVWLPKVKNPGASVTAGAAFSSAHPGIL